MPHKPRQIPKPDDPEESKRFIDTAREVEASEEAEDFERAFDKVAKPKPKKLLRRRHVGGRLWFLPADRSKGIVELIFRIGSSQFPCGLTESLYLRGFLGHLACHGDCLL